MSVAAAATPLLTDDVAELRNCASIASETDPRRDTTAVRRLLPRPRKGVAPRRCGAIVSLSHLMFIRALVLVTALVASAAPARAADARSDAKEQVEFGIRVAQNGLWKEAAYRW